MAHLRPRIALQVLRIPEGSHIDYVDHIIKAFLNADMVDELIEYLEVHCGVKHESTEVRIRCSIITEDPFENII